MFEVCFIFHWVVLPRNPNLQVLLSHCDICFILVLSRPSFQPSVFQFIKMCSFGWSVKMPFLGVNWVSSFPPSQRCEWTGIISFCLGFCPYGKTGFLFLLCILQIAALGVTGYWFSHKKYISSPECLFPHAPKSNQFNSHLYFIFPYGSTYVTFISLSCTKGFKLISLIKFPF